MRRLSKAVPGQVSRGGLFFQGFSIPKSIAEQTGTFLKKVPVLILELPVQRFFKEGS
jgi:hypothetical protein